MFKIFSLLFLAVYLNASTLLLKEGDLTAQIDVTFKGLIDINTKELSSKLTMNDDVESIKGLVVLKSYSLKSDDKDRDSNMYELLQSKLYPFISFKFESIEKVGDNYVLNGLLHLNGISKKIQSIAKIKNMDDSLSMNGKFNILLTDFNMKPPSMIIINVDNKIDINYNLNYTKD